MVIRTEMTSQRAAMGTSDPFLVGFEIRFGSLNFQATGMTTICASSTGMNSTRGGRPGQARPRHTNDEPSDTRNGCNYVDDSTTQTLRPTFALGARGAAPGSAHRRAGGSAATN
jgi:hypothetical protein